MSKRLLGAHMPASKGIPAAIRNGAAIGCTAVQVFTSSPQQWKSRDIGPEEPAEVKKAIEETGIGSLISHDSYLINLCAVEQEKRDRSRIALARELSRCSTLGIPIVISHLGAHMGAGEEEGLKVVSEQILEILAESPSEVTLTMETTAGQGSSLNYKFEHIARIFELTKSPANLGVCLDTCHVFAAGYDIRTADSYEAVMSEFDKVVGCERLVCLHLNDSKKPLGSKLDRHEHIGEGEIGEDAFRFVLNDPRIKDKPMVVETPKAEEFHEKNVALLWSLCE